MKSIKLLSVCLVAAMMLAGCGNKAPAADAPSADAPAQSGDAPAAVNKLVIGVQSYSTITDYQDNYLTNLLAEKLGCEIEVMQLPADLAELQTKIALMATTPEELPDVIFSGDLPYEMVVEYGNNGVFLDVSSYMDDPASMPNFNAIPEEHRNMIKNGALADGKVYAISKFSGDAWSQTPCFSEVKRKSKTPHIVPKKKKTKKAIPNTDFLQNSPSIFQPPFPHSMRKEETREP